MKIVITSDLYYPMTNGVAVFAHILARGLAKQGHEVGFLSEFYGTKASRKERWRDDCISDFGAVSVLSRSNQ